MTVGVGLEYYAADKIDVAIAAYQRSGNLVVFEVKASMLVHAHNEEFPYKAPFVHGIKLAFDAMLRKFASAGA